MENLFWSENNSFDQIKVFEQKKFALVKIHSPLFPDDPMNFLLTFRKFSGHCLKGNSWDESKVLWIMFAGNITFAPSTVCDES